MSMKKSAYDQQSDSRRFAGPETGEKRNAAHEEASISEELQTLVNPSVAFDYRLQEMDMSNAPTIFWAVCC